ncbi:hypothetical protein TNCV_772111 [Trichonephila clavipes]|nr:hypothetical protein TNCV_772111 [Trichonephila clavipes]
MVRTTTELAHHIQTSKETSIEISASPSLKSPHWSLPPEATPLHQPDVNTSLQTAQERERRAAVRRPVSCEVKQ